MNRIAARFGLLLLGFFFAGQPAFPQSNPGSIEGVVKDPSGGVVANALVELHNPVSRFDQSTTSGAQGEFRFTNVPFNPYHLSVKIKGFQEYVQDVDVRSQVPTNIQVTLAVAGSATTVTVEGTASDLVENDPHFHTHRNTRLFDKLPLATQPSPRSSLVP